MSTTPPDRRDTARQLREQGLTCPEIAARIGAHPTTVWRWLNPEKTREAERARREYKRNWERNNHPLSDRRPCDHLTLRDIRRLREMRASGMTMRAIAEEVGVSRSTIRRHTADLGKTFPGAPS